MPGPTDRAARPVASRSALTAAIAVMNVATYGYTIVAARALGPQPYGAFAAVMNLLLVISVAQLALQALAARRISAHPDDVEVVEDGVRRLTWRAAVAVGALLLVAAPLVDRLLRLDSLPTALLVAVIAVPMTLMGGMAGILQGERRWRPLALLYLAAGLPRLVVGTALILARPTESFATLGVLVGSLFPVLVGVVAVRGHRRIWAATPRSRPSPVDHGVRALAAEAAHNSHALLAFFAVSNVDILVARNVLDAHDAGLYAGGLILTKAALLLPQFVIVLAFPTMADAENGQRALRLSLALLSVMGVVGVTASWLLPDLALVFVGGSAYAEVASKLWLFALLGTVLAMIQLLVYGLMASRSSRAVAFLWVALVVIIGGGRMVDSLSGLITLVVAVDVVLLATLAIGTLTRRPDRASASEH